MIGTVKFDEHAIDVNITKTTLYFVLADGREISAPLEWFPRLRDATDVDRNNWRFIGNGIGVHWPSGPRGCDEYISGRACRVSRWRDGAFRPLDEAGTRRSESSSRCLNAVGIFAIYGGRMSNDVKTWNKKT